MSASAADVLVIGAGPSGLFAAVELARHGVAARVVEREPHPHRQARATAIQPGTLEILARAGLLEAVLTSSVHVRAARLLDPDLTLLAEMSFAGTGCRWEHQCSLPQWRTEELLTERLGQLGGAVERGVTVTSLETREDAVYVQLARADGSAETIEASWVIGAGGAHSVTRASMHEELTGETYPGTALVADVSVRADLPRDASALIAGERGYVMLAPLPENRWIAFVGDLDDDEVDRVSSDTSAGAVAASIGRRVSADVRVDDVAWAAPFRMHHRLVARLADERRFLLGDAGHLSSPFGGEGLNSGLQDAHNLAWKLALVLGGRARPTILATFATERLAADRHVLDVSDQVHRSAHGAVDSARSGMRAAPPPPDQLAAFVRSRLMLDVSYAGSPLVGEYHGDGEDAIPAPGPGERYPDRAALQGTRHQLLLFGAVDDAALAHVRRRWDSVVDVVRSTEDLHRAGVDTSGAVLVRPDGHIGFRAVPADAGGLTALDSHLAAFLVPARA